MIKPSVPIDIDPITGKKIQLRHRKEIGLIEKEIINGIPYSTIAKKYHVNVSSITRYKQKYLSKKVNTYVKDRDIKDAETIWETINNNVRTNTELIESIKQHLADPNDPSKIDVAPQGNAVQVTYTLEGKRHKDSLNNILKMIENNGITPVKVEINTPDRVKTLIEAMHVLNKQLHLVTGIQGMIGNTTINIANQPMFVAFVQQVISVLNDYPEAKQKLIAEVRTLSTNDIITVEPQSVLGRD